MFPHLNLNGGGGGGGGGRGGDGGILLLHLLRYLVLHLHRGFFFVLKCPTINTGSKTNTQSKAKQSKTKQSKTKPRPSNKKKQKKHKTPQKSTKPYQNKINTKHPLHLPPSSFFSLISTPLSSSLQLSYRMDCH